MIVSSIIGCGPRLLGYALGDELLTAAVLLAALVRFSLLKPDRTEGGMTLHKFVFLFWAGYMIVESVIGILINSDLRIMEWLLFYGMLGLLAQILACGTKKFPFPSIRQFSLIVVVTTMGFNFMYGLVGMYYQRELGPYGRFSMQFLTQGFLWVGTAIAAFPSIIAMPASIFLIGDNSRRVRILAWYSILLMLVIGMYYDSSSTLIIVFTFLVFSLKRIGVKGVLTFATCFVLIFCLQFGHSRKLVWGFLGNLFEVSYSLLAPKTQEDSYRKLQLEGGIIRLADNARTFLIGDGIYSHRFTMHPVMAKLYAERLAVPPQIIQAGHAESHKRADGAGIFRTTAFTGLLVDTGVVGMFLFLANFVLVARKLFRRTSVRRNILLLMLLIAFGWLFINNISGIVMLYLLIIPSGLIEQLNRRAIIERGSVVCETNNRGDEVEIEGGVLC